MSEISNNDAYESMTRPPDLPSPFERKKMLDERIAFSKKNPTSTRIDRNRRIKQYKVMSDMNERQISPDTVFSAQRWIKIVSQSSLIQCPEYIESLTMRDDWDQGVERVNNNPGAIEWLFGKGGYFERGGKEWSVGPSFYSLSVSGDNVLESMTIYDKQISYTREEDLAVGEKAIVAEENTIEAVAGVENLISQLRDLGKLVQPDDILLLGDEQIWKRYIKTAGFIRGAIGAASMGIGSYFQQPESPKQLATLGASYATLGFLSWKTAREEVGIVKEKINSLVVRGELMMGDIPKME